MVLVYFCLGVFVNSKIWPPAICGRGPALAWLGVGVFAGAIFFSAWSLLVVFCVVVNKSGVLCAGVLFFYLLGFFFVFVLGHGFLFTSLSFPVIIGQVLCKYSGSGRARIVFTDKLCYNMGEQHQIEGVACV